jgi:methyltransferase family protein
VELEVLRSYLERHEDAEGWFLPGAAQLFALVDRIQRERGVLGDLFEIGVHHGKSTRLLGLMADPARERLRVCDLFGLQDGNVSHSGLGNRAVFEQHMRSWFADLSFLDVHEQRSGRLTPEQTGTAVRFFHIDGGHTAGETVRDLRVASAALHEVGVVVVDDYFNVNWPAVSEGVCRYVLRNPQQLAPIAIGFNKVFFVRPDQQEEYVQRLRQAPWREYLAGFRDRKEIAFFGVPVIIWR